MASNELVFPSDFSDRSIVIRGEHRHQSTGEEHAWHATYAALDDARLRVEVVIPIAASSKAFIDDAVVRFDPATTHPAMAVRRYVHELIDRTDFARCEADAGSD
jgi:hypothetical protein